MSFQCLTKAVPCEIGQIIPVTCFISLKMSIYKEDITGHDQIKWWWMVPLSSHCLQYVGCVWVANLDIVYGVKYHRSSIF